MGLSSIPAPAEGFICIILVNTAQSISIFKAILCFILQIVGILLSSYSSSPEPPVETSSASYDFHLTPSDTFVEELRQRIPAIRFSSIIDCNRSDHDHGHDCTVCLTRFESDSEVNHLSCGHFFHKVCLEKWLDYWNITCPLCRTPLMPEYEDFYGASCLLW
ncbi:zinc finger protein [Macleaya cordata]|uniref:Zinc finger protein n=1 Tax=Macleaya cordata TaxID=56857 RepID=A0A200RAK4_MACCD|nr:zinc finger protein [Macleaya cordata]